MNRELIAKIRDRIKAEPHMYDQTQWGTRRCHTPCCIAGWTLICDAEYNNIPLDKGVSIFDPTQLVEEATRRLQISDSLANNLFAHDWPTHWIDGQVCRFVPRPDEAVIVLDKILTGVIPSK